MYEFKLLILSGPVACGGRSVGVVRSRDQATEFFLVLKAQVKFHKNIFAKQCSSRGVSIFTRPDENSSNRFGGQYA
jgi:hypothetical protein